MSELTDALAARIDELNTSVQANTDATNAISTAVDGYKAEIADLQQKLQDALNADDTEALQDAINGLGTLKDKIDADTVATNALANTPAAPTP